MLGRTKGEDSLTLVFLFSGTFSPVIQVPSKGIVSMGSRSVALAALSPSAFANGVYASGSAYLPSGSDIAV